MIMENYHQSDDELDCNDKSELRQSNHYTDDLDTISLMKTINTIYSVGQAQFIWDLLIFLCLFVSCSIVE